MPRLWTLSEPSHVHGSLSEYLNGKIFLITKCINGLDQEAVRFIDACNNNVICETSKVIKVDDNNDFLSILTTDELFTFINVESLIPSKEIPTEESENEESNVLSYKLIEEDHQPIYYENGCTLHGYCSLYKYHFNREISEKEFIDFCISNNHKIGRLQYSEILGTGDTWTYKWFDVFND